MQHITQSRVQRTVKTIIQSSALDKWRDACSSPFSGLYTLFLFTKSDIKTVILPTLAFALSNTLSKRAAPEWAHTFLPASTESDSAASSLSCLPRIILAVAWTWLGLLMETIANQRLPHSVAEDAINKPWRPMVIGRVSADQARRLLIGALAAYWVLSVFLDAQGPFFTMAVLTYVYNDLRGADEHLLLRNALNAGGLMAWGVGSTLIAAGQSTALVNVTPSAGFAFGIAAQRAELTRLGWVWIATVATIIATTVSTQDLADAEGDRKQKRRTLPLVWGDRPTRIYLAVVIFAWNVACSLFWQLSVTAALLPATVNILLVTNIFFGRSKRADKTSWKLWCAWMISLYFMPLLASL